MAQQRWHWMQTAVSMLVLAWATAATVEAAPTPPPAPTAAAAAAAAAMATNRTADSSFCGQPGKAPCSYNCVETGGPTSWKHRTRHPIACSRSRSDRLPPSGCRKGLTRVVFTADSDMMPDLCLPLPTMSSGCGHSGQACCLTPAAGTEPWNNIRAKCRTGLTCIVKSIDSLPFGSSRHAQAILGAGTSSSLAAVLRSTSVMGACQQLQPTAPASTVTKLALPPVQRYQTAQGKGATGSDTLHMPCGHTQPCGTGSWCAGQEEHYLQGARCLPLPPCGGANQPCCPPNAHGSFQPAHASILDGATPMPFCTDPDSTCLWQPDMADLGQGPAQNDLRLRPPQPSYSMSVTFLGAMCMAGLSSCGKKGQPCCPHAQFAVSNTEMYFRSHVCDAGLACDATIDFSGDVPVLGVCRGVAQQCGRVGQACCKHTDAAGWSWKTCNDGQPGVYCGKVTDVCKACPDSSSMRMTAALAAEVGDGC